MVFGDLRHAVAIACILGVAGGTCGEPYAAPAVQVVNPRLLEAGDVSAVRTPLGVPNDYKPWVARLKNGQLLIVGFCYGGNPYREQAVFWRSDDGGLTWGPRRQRDDIPGREFSLNCLADGTLLMPC